MNITSDTPLYPTTDQQFKSLVNLYVLYVIVGVVSGAANLLMVIVILSRKELREKYLAQMILALGDFSDSFGHMTAGSMRLSYLYSDQFNVPSTPFKCMLTPFNAFFILTALLTGVSTMVISTERFICVSQPSFYFQHPMKQYVAIACLVGVGFSVVSVGFGFVVAYNRVNVVTKSCVTSLTVGDTYSLFYYGTNVAAFGVAIIMYVATTYITCRSKVGTENTHDQQYAAKLARQAKVTRMMGAVFGNIFLLQFVQNFTLVVAVSTGGNTQPWFTQYVGYSSLLMDISGPLNAITYAIFNEEMRNGFKAILMCRCGKKRPEHTTFGQHSTTAAKPIMPISKLDVEIL